MQKRHELYIAFSGTEWQFAECRPTGLILDLLGVLWSSKLCVVLASHNTVTD
jgi:hypothetical protein